ARTTPHSRALIAERVGRGQSAAAVARDLGVCDRTVHKWVARAAEGALALEDRSCRPHGSPRAISAGPGAGSGRPRRLGWAGGGVGPGGGAPGGSAACRA